MYPKITIDINKLRDNATFIKKLCEKGGRKTALVVKSMCANHDIVKELDSVEVDYFADSRIQNLKKLKDLNTKKMLLRIPMLCEVEDVIKYADISMNSELDTLKALNKAAKTLNKVHSVIIMVDLGDLREGYFEAEDLKENIKEIIKLENIEIKGIGVNLTCYGAVIPKNDNLSRLCDIADELRTEFNLELPIVSGGNSSSIYLIDKGELPEGITNLRVGESMLLGRETAYGEDIIGMNNDVFELKCQIVELKEKPSLPIGEIGVDAFGNKPYYEDKGIRKRAILAIGQQDTDISSLMPIDDKLEILGASSDHLIVDVSDSNTSYKVGDIITFRMGYGALLKGFTSEYIEKELL